MSHTPGQYKHYFHVANGATLRVEWPSPVRRDWEICVCKQNDGPEPALFSAKIDEDAVGLQDLPSGHYYAWSQAKAGIDKRGGSPWHQLKERDGSTDRQAVYGAWEDTATLWIDQD